MPEVKVNLDKRLDKKVKLYMVKHDLRSKEKAILHILIKRLK